MVLEEFVVIVRGQNGRGKRQFSYFADPKKKPNSESVLRDFRLDSHIHDEREWRLCTLNGKEIRWLADFADRVLVLEPVQNGKVASSNGTLLPRLYGQSPKLAGGSHVIASDSDELTNDARAPVIGRTKSGRSESPDNAVLRRRLPTQRFESSPIISLSSTPKLPSLSTTSSSSGSNFLSSSLNNSKRSREVEGVRRLAMLPKRTDSRPEYVERDNRNRKNDRAPNKRERSR